MNIMVICADEGTIGVPGKWVDCIKCKKKIYLSNTTVEAARERGVMEVEIQLFCMECGALELLKGDIPIANLTNKQKIEIKNNLGSPGFKYK